MRGNEGCTTPERAALLASTSVAAGIVAAWIGTDHLVVWAALSPAVLAVLILERRWRSPTGRATIAEFDLLPNRPLAYAMIGPLIWLIVGLMAVA